MQLQKEKKHLQKTMQELELARKVELLPMLVLNGVPKHLAHLAVLNASLSKDFKAGNLQKGECEGFCPWLCAWRAEGYLWNWFCFYFFYLFV